MNLTVLSFVVAGALLLAGVFVREREVPAAGSIGRGPTAWALSAALAVVVVVAAVLTMMRFGELAA